MGKAKKIREKEMYKFVFALLVVCAFASEEVVGPSPRPQAPPAGSPLAQRLKANSPCAGDKCNPEPPMCDPQVPGSCEQDMLPPTQISCDSITHCGPCTMHLHCGWCAKEKKCMAGGVAGATGSSASNCTQWDYAYCTQDPCSVYNSCSACSADPMCGWCSSTSACVEGSAKGPWLNRCGRDSFSFDTCALSAKSPSISTVVNAPQANLQVASNLLGDE